MHSKKSPPKDKTKIIFLETCLTELGAMAIERRMIAWYGRKIDNGILINLASGGEGASGYKHTPERTAKMVATRLKTQADPSYVSPLKGLSQSKSQIAAARKGLLATIKDPNYVNPKKGIPFSPEHIKKRSESRIKNSRDPNYIQPRGDRPYKKPSPEVVAQRLATRAKNRAAKLALLMLQKSQEGSGC